MINRRHYFYGYASIYLSVCHGTERKACGMNEVWVQSQGRLFNKEQKCQQTKNKAYSVAVNRNTVLCGLLDRGGLQGSRTGAGSGTDCVGSRTGAVWADTAASGALWADSVGSRNGAGPGVDCIGSRNGAGSVGSRNAEGSGADCVSSRNRAGSGADSILKAEPLRLRARLMYPSSDSPGSQ